MTRFLLKYKLRLGGVVLGAIAGYIYYTTTACTTGTCIITASPANTMIYGAILGALLFSIFEKEPKP